MNREQIELIKRTIAKGCTDDELALFLQEAARTGLDPFARQIVPVKRWDAREQREVMAILITIDGARLIAERSGKYAGQDAPQWCGEDGHWTDVWLAKAPPAAARVTVYRHDWERGMTATALYTAYVQTKKDSSPMARWAVDPAGMLAKCAESLSLRKCFPHDLSGLYTREEMGTEDVVDALPVRVATSAIAAPAPAMIEAPESPKPAPTNGDTKPAAAPAPAKPIKSASVGNCPGWKLAAVDLVKETGDYYRKNELVDWFHLLGAAHKLGYSEITDANLQDVIAALRDYAAANTQQAQADEQAALL